MVIPISFRYLFTLPTTLNSNLNLDEVFPKVDQTSFRIQSQYFNWNYIPSKKAKRALEIIKIVELKEEIYEDNFKVSLLDKILKLDKRLCLREVRYPHIFHVDGLKYTEAH